MEELETINNGQTFKAITAIDNIITDNLSLKCDRINDLNLCRHLDNQNNQLENLKKLITISPRFPWAQIQIVIDEHFRKDKNLSGVFIKFIWGVGTNFLNLHANVNKSLKS